MLEDIKIYTCTACGKQSSGRERPNRCNKCGGKEFDEKPLFEKRPLTTDTHRPIMRR